MRLKSALAQRTISFVARYDIPLGKRRTAWPSTSITPSSLRGTARHRRSFWPKCWVCQRHGSGGRFRWSPPGTAPTSISRIPKARSRRSITPSWSANRNLTKSSAESANDHSRTGRIRRKSSPVRLITTMAGAASISRTPMATYWR
jgi:hypothetical protein